jgi:hypothetical protein
MSAIRPRAYDYCWTAGAGSDARAARHIGPGDQREFGSLAVYGAGTLLSKSLGETVEARARRLFGFERFSIDPFFESGERTPGPRVTLGKQITEKLTVTYQTVIADPEQGQLVV